MSCSGVGSGPLLEVLGVAYHKSWVLLFGAAMHLIYALASVGTVPPVLHLVT
jgi:hypothetical protein